MSLRYRLIHVNATRTQELRRFNFNFITANTNNLTVGSGSARQQSATGMEEALISASGGNISAVPSNILLLRSTNSEYDSIASKGYSNMISVQIFSVGDRLYIDRWDANHSYLEVTAVSIASDNCSVTFKYCCYDGTVYLNGIVWGCSLFLGQPATAAIPLCANFDNWDEASDAKVVGFSMTDYYGNRPGLVGNISNTGGGFTLETAEKFWSHGQPLDENNPYSGAGESGPGGGHADRQNWDPNSDTVEPDEMPDETSFGAQASGLVTIFVPSDIQLRNLAGLLYSSDFFSYFVKEMTGITDLFISLGMVPFNVQGSSAAITFMDYASIVTPGVPAVVSLDKAPKQFYDFDMGSINMETDSRVFRSDSCLDYSPYCKLGIFLPFIGYQELNIDECRDATLHLEYRIDLLSGSTLAILSIDGKSIYQFSGNCLTQLPISSADAGSMISDAVNIGIAAASAGATGAIASAGDALTAERLENGSLSAAGAELQHAQHAGQVANAQGSLSSATANGVMGMKPNFKKTGAIGAGTSMFGVKQPYLFLTTPNVAVPEHYEKYCGLPCNITGKLGDFSGYTVVEDIRLNNLVALSPEVEEIYKLLKSGIIV